MNSWVSVVERETVNSVFTVDSTWLLNEAKAEEPREPSTKSLNASLSDLDVPIVSENTSLLDWPHLTVWLLIQPLGVLVLDHIPPQFRLERSLHPGPWEIDRHGPPPVTCRIKAIILKRLA